MIIVPGRSYEPVVTRHSRELQQRVEHVVREYRSQHDDVSDEELRSALHLATRATTGDNDMASRKRIIILVAVAAAAVMAGVVVAATSRSGQPNDIVYWIFPALAGVLGIVIAVIRRAWRN